MPKLPLLFSFAILFLLCAFIHSQDFNADEYVTGMTIVGKVGADSSCPPIVWVVTPDTPAAKAGIQPGDRVLAIDGHHGIDIVQAQPLLHTKNPMPSTIELDGPKGAYRVTVGRIRASTLYDKQGWKVGPDGGLYAKDAIEAEMKRVSKTNAELSGKVFAVGHYPTNLEVYYPGFELLVWKDPHVAVTISGIEDGPARRAGVHDGDTVVSVNGVNPLGKSLAELEQLFSSAKPTVVTLVVERDGSIKEFTFPLAKASDVAEANHKRMYKGRMIPSIIPVAYLRCFEPRQKSPQ